MEKKILSALSCSWEAALEWAKSQSNIYADMEIPLKETKIVQCRENYRKSLFGDAYLEGGMPKLNDKDMAISAYGFYIMTYGKQLERLEKQDDSGSQIEEIICKIMEDADVFFKNYLLERYLSQIPRIILDSFNNYSQAKSFVKRVNPNMTAKEVVQLYREISGRKSPNDNGGWPITAFTNDMNKMGICYLGHRSLQTEFAK